MEISEKEIYRYLGYHGADPTAEVARRVEQCAGQLLAVIEPRFVFRRLPVVFPSVGSASVRIGSLELHSHSLCRNLSGCGEAFVFAATLGIGPDRLIRRAEVSRIADAAIYQAAGAEIIEAWCEEKNEELRQSVLSQGLFLRPRFSPGYGDCPLEVQRDISRILDMPKTIGVCLTDSLLMVPSKSVTAFVGISDRPQDRRRGERHCESCPLTECAFREP